MLIPAQTTSSAVAFATASALPPFSVIEVITGNIAYYFYTNSLMEVKPFTTFDMDAFISTATTQAAAVTDYNTNRRTDGFCTYTTTAGAVSTIEIVGGAFARSFTSAPTLISGTVLSANGFNGPTLLGHKKISTSVNVNRPHGYYLADVNVPFLNEFGGHLEKINVVGTLFNDKNVSISFSFDVSEIKKLAARRTYRHTYKYGIVRVGKLRMYCRARCIVHNDEMSIVFFTFGRQRRRHVYGTIDTVKGVYYGTI